VAGGLAGKEIAEAIDPTEEDEYWRKHYQACAYVPKGAKYDAYQPAYQYGRESAARHTGAAFEDVESDLARGWRKASAKSDLTWDQARPAVRDAWDRTIQLREERLRVHKTPVRTGEAKVRKEVVTERKQIEVPVEREEIVIERRPVRGRKAAGAIRAGEEIRIPVKEEKVHVSKEAVVTEEVSVGKRKVTTPKRVSGTVRKERLRVDQSGDVKVRNDAPGSRARRQS
jgi:uncharacterized protein (TIGR02271 family)